MPVENTRLPAYFGLSTVSPRSTHSSVAGSRMREIDRGLGLLQGRLVLGIEVARVAHEHDRGLALAARPPRCRDRPRPWPAASGSRASASARGSSIAWQKCVPAVRMRQHVGEEDALIDLDAVLVALHLLALRIDLPARRRQAGNERSRPRRRAARRARSASGSWSAPRRARCTCLRRNASRALAPGGQDRLGGARLLGIALRLLRQRAEQLVALEPELRMPVGVVLEVAA